jgi:hypothetical protein
MPLLTKGKTNWKYILIVLILAVIVGGEILGYLRYFKKEIVLISQFPEIKKPEKKEVSLTTDKIEYKQGENVNIILDTGGKEIYLQKNVFTGKILISKGYEVYKLQDTDWVELRINTYCGNVMVCGESGPLPPPCPAPPQPECNKITNRITWVWDQKMWEYVEKTCANIPYTDEELKQVEPGTYKIRVTYYDSNSCTGIPKYLETQFKITDETANLAPSEVEGWKTYRNEELGFEIKYPQNFFVESEQFHPQAPIVFIIGFADEQWKGKGVHNPAVYIHVIKTTLSPREWLEENGTSISVFCGGPEEPCPEKSYFYYGVSDVKQVNINDIPVLQFRHYGVSGSNKSTLFKKEPDTLYQIDAHSSGAGIFPQDIYDQMLSTFRFLE